MHRLLPDPQDPGAITHVLSTIPPDRNGDDPVLSHLLPLLSTLPLRWADLSTTGVYGDRQGRVSETDAPNPGSTAPPTAGLRTEVAG